MAMKTEPARSIQQPPSPFRSQRLWEIRCSLAIAGLAILHKDNLAQPQPPASQAPTTPEETRKRFQDMPLVARVISIVAGGSLIALCLILFLSVRPLAWKAVCLGIGAGGLGADLIYGGIRGRWPVGALLWLVP